MDLRKMPKVDTEEELIEQPPLPPPSNSRWSGIDSIMGSGVAKTIGVAFVVTVVTLLLMSFAGGVTFVTKSDFTANMATVVATLDEARVGLVKAQSDVAVALQNIPGTISAQVNNAVAQSTSQFNSQISSVSDKVNATNNNIQSNSSRISEISNRVDANALALNSQDSEITKNISTLEQRTATYESRISELAREIADHDASIIWLSQQVHSLRNQYIILSVTVDETIKQYSIASGATVYTPPTVVNNGDTAVTAPVKLVLSTATSGLVVTNAGMSGTYTVSIVGSTVTFRTTVDVPAKSSVTLNGVYVVLNYTVNGLPPTGANTFTAIWSKQ